MSVALQVTAKWFNDNQGVVSLSIFVATLVLGWVSGVFSALRRKLKFRLSLIAGPTFCYPSFVAGRQGNPGWMIQRFPRKSP